MYNVTYQFAKARKRPQSVFLSWRKSLSDWHRDHLGGNIFEMWKSGKISLSFTDAEFQRVFGDTQAQGTRFYGFHILGGGDWSVGIGDIDATVTIEDNILEDQTESFREALAEFYDIPKGAVQTLPEYLKNDDIHWDETPKSYLEETLDG